MTVQLTPVGKRYAPDLSLTNKTWFELVNNAKFGDILKCGCTNDPIKVSAAACKKLLLETALYEPSDNWFVCSGYTQDKFKVDFMMFLAECATHSGFRVS